MDVFVKFLERICTSWKIFIWKPRWQILFSQIILLGRAFKGFTEKMAKAFVRARMKISRIFRIFRKTMAMARWIYFRLSEMIQLHLITHYSD